MCNESQVLCVYGTLDQKGKDEQAGGTNTAVNALSMFLL